MERGVRFGEVLNDLRRDSGIEDRVCKRKRGRVALQDVDPVAESGGRDPPRGDRVHVRADVHRDDPAGCTDLPCELTGEEPGARTEVQDRFAG